MFKFFKNKSKFLKKKSKSEYLNSESESVSMENVPSDVLSSVLSNLNPSELLVSSCVSKQWYNVVNMQSTWKNICPPDFCSYYVEKGGSASLAPEIFFRDVCQGIPLREGKEFLRVDKHSGFLTYFVSIPLAMGITWGDHEQYWNTVEDDNLSVFKSCAYLRDVCWFHISSSSKVCLKPGKYHVFWRVSRSQSYGRRGGINLPLNSQYPFFSWPIGKVKSEITLPDLNISTEKLLPFTDSTIAEHPMESEILAAEFEIGPELSGKELEILARLTETTDMRWKSGVYFDSLVIRQVSVLL